MVANSSSGYVSPETYLSGEENSPEKHEYRDGQIYAMAGASNAHVLIAVNFATALRTHLRGKSCLTFASDTKVHIAAINTYYYPDVVVSCDERDPSFSNFVRYPRLIVEVLSDTTEAFDRGDKFADYRQIETLQEYVLFSQKRMSVDVFRRNPADQWVLTPYTNNTDIQLASIDFQSAIATLYEDVTFMGHSS